MNFLKIITRAIGMTITKSIENLKEMRTDIEVNGMDGDTSKHVDDPEDKWDDVAHRIKVDVPMALGLESFIASFLTWSIFMNGTILLMSVW